MVSYVQHVIFHVFHIKVKTTISVIQFSVIYMLYLYPEVLGTPQFYKKNHPNRVTTVQSSGYMALYVERSFQSHSCC